MKREKRLRLVIVLNIIITLSQIVGGIIANSFALISDALHNFSDVAALIISLVALLLAKKAATYSRSFGYKRAEVLAAFVNSALIMAVAFFIIIKSSIRLTETSSIQINNDLIIWLAFIAIIGNGISVWILSSQIKDSMNMKSSFLHLLSDTLFSVAVLLGGLAMKYYGVVWVDSILSIIIGVYLIISSWRLLIDSMHVLLQFVPKSIDIPALVKAVEALPEIKNLHHVHVWQLDEHAIHFEAHVDLQKNLPVTETHVIQLKITDLLKSDFDIGHITLQFEHGLHEHTSPIQ